MVRGKKSVHPVNLLQSENAIFNSFSPIIYSNSLTPTYYPNSKLRKNVTFELRGVKNLFPFTMWCWNLLGLSFSFSAYVGWRTGRGEQVSPWVLRAALLLWEMAAPFTLFVGAIVKYVLWPTAFKHNGTVGTTNFRTWIAMCQHNVNVVMALSEVALLGGLPVKMSHISLSVLFGVAYVVFTWSIVNLWNPQTGPAFIYIFMDTTLGAFATIALYALVGALMVFYGIFSGVEWLLELSASGLLGHIAFVVLLCMLVCKVRD